MDVSGQNLLSKKYFIAIVLPQPGYDEIEKIKHELHERFGLRGGLRSPPHITLHRPFEWKEKKEDQLIAALSDFEGPSPFEIHISNFSFFEPRVVFAAVIPSPQLELLHSTLTDYCKKNLKLFNEAEDLRGFHPHVTVAFRDLRKPLFYELKDDFMNRKISFSFTCSEFQLLRFEKKWEIIQTFGSNTV